MATEFSKACDKDQGFDFKQDKHKTFGYLNTLVIGDVEIPADINAVEAAADHGIRIRAGGESGRETAGFSKKPVVAVLKNASWNMLPTGMITLEGLVSTSNMQTISMLTKQGSSQIVICFSFVIYEYDPIAKLYFPSFCSYAGSPPVGITPGKTGISVVGSDPNAVPIYGMLGKEEPKGALPIAAATPILGDGPLGGKEFNLYAAPLKAKEPQQIKIQTSNTNKMVKGWGLPQG